MSEHEMALGDERPPECAPETLACYEGVPDEVVTRCESLHLTSKVIRLEALRQVRDLLAPFGQFKQWCLDHAENYHAVLSQLSHADTTTKRPIKGSDPAAWIDAPERVVRLEAEVAQKDEAWQRVNHELANAHDLIKRLRARFTPEERRAFDRKEVVRQRTEWMRQAREESPLTWTEPEQPKPLSPAQQRRRELAKRKAEERRAKEAREYILRIMENDVDWMVRHVPSEADVRLLTAEQRVRYATLARGAARVAKSLGQLVAAVEQQS